MARVRATTAHQRGVFISLGLAKEYLARWQILDAFRHGHRLAEAEPMLIDRTHNVAVHGDTATPTGEVAARRPLGRLTARTMRGRAALGPAGKGYAGQTGFVLMEIEVISVFPTGSHVLAMVRDTRRSLPRTQLHAAPELHATLPATPGSLLRPAHRRRTNEPQAPFDALA